MKYRRILKIPVFAAIILVASGTHTIVAADDGSAGAEGSEFPSAFFEIMAEVLTGAWEGQYASGTIENHSEWKPIRIEYRLTANKTALIEDYIIDGDIGMTSVYHLDNNDLRLAHFCGIGNHPRMIAREYDASSRMVFFDFVDVTNHASPDTYHTRQAELMILSDNHIRINYVGLASGKHRPTVHEMKRVSTTTN